VIRGESAIGDDGFLAGAAVDDPLGGGFPFPALWAGEPGSSCAGVRLTPFTI
jgi:hypothetical protein